MKKNFPISATFIDEITYDIPSSNWTREEWAKDLDNMKEVGIDTVIFIRGGFYNKAIFPSKHFPHLKDENDDFAGFILEEAEKRDMSVFFGLYISTLTWNDGDAKTEIEKNKLFVSEVIQRYARFKSFKGWYIPHEVGNDVFNITEVLYGLGKICKDKTPDKPILISPFFYSSVMVKEGALSPEESFEEWDKILSKSGGYIDYCAFQDGSAPFDQMEEYFESAKRVCDKYGIELWSNVEGLDRDIPKVFAPINFDVLKAKIRKVRPYVKKYITFEFSHFLSPQSIYPAARNLNKLYKDYYEKNPFKD